MKRGTVWRLFRQDLVLCVRNRLVLVTVVTLAAMIAVYHALPLFIGKGVVEHQKTIVIDLTEDRLFSSYVAAASPADLALVESREDLEKLVSGKSGGFGLVASGNREELRIELVFASTPTEAAAAAARGFTRSLTAQILGLPLRPSVRTEILHPENEPIPANNAMIAVLIAFEVMILGFLFVSVLVFGEKAEGVMRAYRVSPAGFVPYVIAKFLVFTSLATLYGLALVICTIGTRVDFLRLACLLLLCCGFMTLLGLGIASFFRSISDWFVPGVSALAVNMLALVPYRLSGSFSPLFSVLPGYTAVFGVHEILFPSASDASLSKTFAILCIETVLCFLFAVWSVRRNSARER